MKRAAKNLQSASIGSPSPLNGERAGVRGGNVAALAATSDTSGGTTPHPQSLSPLGGEGSTFFSLTVSSAQITLVALLVFSFCFGCKREERGFRVSPPQANVMDVVSVSELHPAGSITNAPIKNDYEENAQALSDGKQLFQKMNCVGCHANGGGGMGPALIDDKWIYGSNPEQIYATITQGRPNGM